MHRRYIPFGSLLALSLTLAPAFAGGSKNDKEAEAFFKSPTIHALSIELDPKALDSLRREPRKYVKATLKEGDKVYKDVGVKLKGAAGSFRGIDDKPNVTINMDKFVDDQTFHGLDKFHLANSLQDPSYISELICGEMFRASGVPASRVTHATVTINGRKRGFYYIKEGYDTSFLKRHFTDGSGNFYDGGFLRDIDQPLQLLSGKGPKNHEDLKALIAAVRDDNEKTRFEKFEKLLDVKSFVSYLAMEVITWDWDGYPINRNNYRIYNDPTRNKIVFIPSGMDQMFHDPNGPILPGFNGMVARRFVDTKQGRKLYFDRLEELNKTVLRPERLIKRLDELQARIQPALASVDAGAGRDYPNQVNRLRGGIQQRSKSITEQLSRLKK